jgi:nicotinamide riboside kinase
MDSTLKGQFIFLAERSSELMQTNLITDRTIWDVCSFTALAQSINDNEKYHFEKAAMQLRNEYDLVIYVSPEGVEIENNGVRETDSDYRNQVDYQIKQLLERYPPKKLITVSGTTQERINLILPHIY